MERLHQADDHQDEPEQEEEDAGADTGGSVAEAAQTRDRGDGVAPGQRPRLVTADHVVGGAGVGLEPVRDVERLRR